MRDWFETAWWVSCWTLPVPGVAFGGMLWPGGERAQWVAALLLAAAASLLLAGWAVARAGWVRPGGTTGATAIGLAATVALALVLADRSADPDVVLTCTVLGLPHVALAGLAWPGLQGVVVRAAVATAAVAPAALLALVVGIPVSMVLGPVGVAVGVALGHVVVLVAGTAVARPVALRPLRPDDVALPA